MMKRSNKSKILVNICGITFSLLGKSNKTSENRQIEENINNRIHNLKEKYPNLTDIQLMALSIYQLEKLYLKLTKTINYNYEDFQLLECKDANNASLILGLDPLFEEVARLVVNSNNASTSSLQRRFAIGYNRAGKIMYQLEAMGIVGSERGAKAREILIDPENLEILLKNNV